MEPATPQQATDEGPETDAERKRTPSSTSGRRQQKPARPKSMSSLESFANVLIAKDEEEARSRSAATTSIEAVSSQQIAAPQVSGYIKVKSACTNCRKSRVKCDKLLPCARCRRLNIECTPQLRGRGRPPTVYKEEAPKAARREVSAKHQEGAKLRIPRHLPEATKRKRKRRFEQSREKEVGKRQSIESHTGISYPTQGYDVLVSSFNRFLHEERLDRQSCTSYARLWAFMASKIQWLELKKHASYIANTLGIDIDDIFEGTVAKRDPNQALQYIPNKYFLRDSWDSSDGGYVEQTIIDGTSTLYFNDYFREMFYPDDFHTHSQRDLLTTIIYEKDLTEFYSTLAEPIFTSENGGAGSVVRHVIRFNAKSSSQPVLGLIFHHSFVSLDGSIALIASRILLLPSSQVLSKIRNVEYQPAVISLPVRPPLSLASRIPYPQGVPSNLMSSFAAFRGTPIYGIPFGLQLSPQLGPSSPASIMFSQGQSPTHQGSSSSAVQSVEDSLGMGMISPMPRVVQSEAKEQHERKSESRQKTKSRRSIADPAELEGEGDVKQNKVRTA